MADVLSFVVEWLPSLIGLILLLFILDYLDRAAPRRVKRAMIGAALLAALSGLLYWGLLTE